MSYQEGDGMLFAWTDIKKHVMESFWIKPSSLCFLFLLLPFLLSSLFLVFSFYKFLHVPVKFWLLGPRWLAPRWLSIWLEFSFRWFASYRHNTVFQNKIWQHSAVGFNCRCQKCEVLWWSFIMSSGKTCK